jgi:hypothetical protein
MRKRNSYPLRSGESGDRTPVGAEIFRTRHYRPSGPIQPSINLVSGLSRWKSGRGVVLATHPNLAMRL